MPEDSRVKSAPIGGWTVTHELLAQLIEEVGLLAADRRRKEPLTVNRPDALTDAAVPQGNTRQPQQPSMSGHRQMLAAAVRRGMVQVRD
ncbi:hypothetical protein AB0G49_14000 [Streptomyces longwoodensis]|uniref:hypothetical protein n=1 Tax=Streptomyces longwoodensis TaxID=68231 RepID=UPI0033CA3FEB